MRSQPLLNGRRVCPWAQINFISPNMLARGTNVRERWLENADNNLRDSVFSAPHILSTWKRRYQAFPKTIHKLETVLRREIDHPTGAGQ